VYAIVSASPGTRGGVAAHQFGGLTDGLIGGLSAQRTALPSEPSLACGACAIGALIGMGIGAFAGSYALERVFGAGYDKLL
jgi:hypothetical protein